AYMILRSTDLGFSWEWVFGTLEDPADLLSVIAHESGTIVGGGWGSVFVSQDNGSTWLRIVVPGAFHALCTNSAGEIYAAGDDGVYRSTDIGLNWDVVGLVDEQVTEIIVGLDDQLVAAGIPNGIFVSADNGSSWINTYPQMNDTVVTGFTHNSTGDLFAATCRKGVLRSMDGGYTWEVLEAFSGAFSPRHSLLRRTIPLSMSLFSLRIIRTLSTAFRVSDFACLPCQATNVRREFRNCAMFLLESTISSAARSQPWSTKSLLPERIRGHGTPPGNRVACISIAYKLARSQRQRSSCCCDEAKGCLPWTQIQQAPTARCFIPSCLT
ncbi:MAG: uncharacterized protein HW407_2158, partial [Bacteroidetes bacterium]|nr:uncharacterized protein [Bacteroidota bacterium]